MGRDGVYYSDTLIRINDAVTLCVLECVFNGFRTPDMDALLFNTFARIKLAQ